MTDKPTILQRIKSFRESRINAILTSKKEYWLMFLLLVAFNGMHTWLFMYFLENGMLETHVRTVINTLIVYVIVAAILITTFVAYFRKHILKGPLEELCSAAQKIAKGDFSIRVGSKRTGGEKNYIEALFDDFNTMTEELATMNEKLKALSSTDELTKLSNRRAFMEYMEVIWKQNCRLSLPVTVMLIDVDYFKKYNDSLGHLEGDKALIAVAQCLKKQTKRETDFAARFGGEEFVCLLPFVDKAGAMEFAEALVQGIESMNIPHPKSEVSKYVTISVGIATAVPDGSNSITQLLDSADKALYTAKASGRNRVAVY